MSQELTITLADDVYERLSQRVGQADISRFIENLIRPHLVDEIDLEAEYREMAADEEREREASALL